MFCTCCSADGWPAFFILRFPGDDNPQHSGRTGDWKHPKRDNMFFGLFTIWMAIWKAAQQNTGVHPEIWSEDLFVLLSLVANAASKSDVYSASWINETLEGSRKACYFITRLIWHQQTARVPEFRVARCMFWALAGSESPVYATQSPNSILETALTSQAGDPPWWSLPATSWAELSQNVQTAQESPRQLD